MKKLFACIKTDFLINKRNGLIPAIPLVTLLLCGFVFFFLMPGERVAGDALTSYTWATQIFIIEGTVFGFIIASAENADIQELLYTLDGSLYQKRWSKIVVSVIMAILLACICGITCSISLYRLKAPGVCYPESMKYILLYWILPFLIAAAGGEGIADVAFGKAKYALLALQMILFGPVVPKLAEPLIDVTTGLYKYAAMFCVGPMNTARPMNLMFGYDLQGEKILAGLLILASLIFFFLGAPENKRLQRAVRISAVAVFVCGILVNIHYIQGKYDYYVTMRDYEAYAARFAGTAEPAESAQPGEPAESAVSTKTQGSLAYEILSEEISVDDGRGLRLVAVLNIHTDVACERITFVLYNGFEIDEIRLDGSEAEYRRNADAVTISYAFAADADYQIELTYHGKPPAHMYFSSDEWILPSYVAWYPVKGDEQSLYFDMYDPCFYDYRQDSTRFTIAYEGNEKIYCSLDGQSIGQSDERSDHIWQGTADSVTLLCSKWMNQLTTADRITVVYPACCKDYEQYLDGYIESYRTAYRAVTEMDGSGEENGEELHSIFFTCDSTYIGHGEDIYPASDHAVIEITRAYVTGDALSAYKPALTVYPLIEAVQFRDIGFAPTPGDMGLYKTAFVTAAINTGKLDDSYLIRSLEEEKTVYENLAGNEYYYNIICVVEECIDAASEEEQYRFLKDFEELMKSGGALTEESVREITSVK